MENFIEKLYCGEIRPCEMPFATTKNRSEMLSKISEMQESITATMTEEEAEQFEEYRELYSQIQSMIETDRFSEGFRLGVLMMLDVVSR